MTPTPDTGTPPATPTAITAVWRTDGCGKDPMGTGAQSIMTMGTKPQDAADSKKGPWSYNRNYNVMLPAGYDKNRAYPLVFLGPGCGGGATAVYGLNSNANNTVIRVGLAPPPDAIGHATNPNEGCFDDKEGDDSVDWVFYERLYDRLATQICFDRNRVFAGGNSSGAWLANELGCKYAGDAKYPIRGIMPNTGGLPDQDRFKPTCTTKPMSGMWIHQIGDTINPFTGNKYAINRAMMVNGCTMGTNYDNAPKDPFPIPGGGGPCQKLRGCPELYPLIVCALPGNGHGGNDNTANPGFAAYLQMFSMGAFLTQ